MTLTSEDITRAIVVVVLGAATVGMFVISLRGNYLYGYSVGQSDEKRTLFAWANVAADVWKAFGLIAVTLLWRNRHRRIAVAGAVAWLVCLLSGVNSAIGVYVQDRASLTGAREAEHATYKDASKELSEVESKLKALMQHRSVGEIDALIAGLLARPVMSGDRVRGTVATLSSDCRKPASRAVEACGELAMLRSERAVAEEARKLEARAEHLRGEISRLREHGNALSPDPVGEFYTWATRGLLSVRDVGFGFPLFFALLIEVVSAFGPITVMRFAEVSAVGHTASENGGLRHAMARYVPPQPAALLMGPEVVDDTVARWMSQRAVPSSDGGAITAGELHADYRQWCERESVLASTLSAFATEFDRLRDMPELSGKIRKFGNRYYGIAIVKSSVRELRARSG